MAKSARTKRSSGKCLVNFDFLTRMEEEAEEEKSHAKKQWHYLGSFAEKHKERARNNEKNGTLNESFCAMKAG